MGESGDDEIVFRPARGVVIGVPAIGHRDPRWDEVQATEPAGDGTAAAGDKRAGAVLIGVNAGADLVAQVCGGGFVGEVR